MWNHTQPNRFFSEDHILASKWCCAPKFLHALKNDQVLLARPHRGRESLLHFLFKRGSKIGLKFDISMPVAFGGKGSTFMKLCHMTGHRVGMITYVQIFGARTPEIWEAKKSKIRLDFKQLLTLTANILRTDLDIKTRKQT